MQNKEEEEEVRIPPNMFDICDEFNTSNTTEEEEKDGKSNNYYDHSNNKIVRNEAVTNNKKKEVGGKKIKIFTTTTTTAGDDTPCIPTVADVAATAHPTLSSTSDPPAFRTLVHKAMT